MPVAMRKRSWEEHVTHASGLKYSYDDLDLVCCHGVDIEGSWPGAGSSKQGQRTRCASMPEGCHQLPTEELSQTIKVMANVTNDETKVFKLMQNNVKVPLDLEEESVPSPHDLVDVDIPQGATEPLQTNHGEPRCNLNSGVAVLNVACEIERKENISGEDEIAVESHSIDKDDNVFKCTHITHEEQQCNPVPLNNEPLLTGCAGEQPGKPPNQQETMENHTEGYSRPPEIFDITLNQSSAAGIESPSGLADAEGVKISTSEQADAIVIPPFGERGRTDSIMENGDEASPPGKAMEPVLSLVEKVHGTESRSSDSTRELDGLNPEPLTENVGPNQNIKSCEDGERRNHGCTVAVDQVKGGEMSNETLLVSCSQAEQHEEGAGLGDGVNDASSDDCKDDCEKVDPGCSGGAMETRLETATSVRDKESESPVHNISASRESEIVVPPSENNGLNLDTIPEVSHSVLHGTPVRSRRNSDFTPNPDVQSHVDDNYITTEKVSQILPPRFTEDYEELLPQRLHSNQEASGCDSSESPDSEVADGYRGHTPATPSSGMKDEAANPDGHSDAQFSSLVSFGMNPPGASREGDVVKIRTKKVCESLTDDDILL